MIGLLVESASRCLVLGGFVGLALFMLRVRNPHLLKTVWFVVLVACLVMPFAVEWRVAPKFDAPAYLLTLTGGGGGVQGAAAGHWLATTCHRLVAAIKGMPTGPIAVVYAAVAVALTARLALGLFSVWRIRRAALPIAATQAHARLLLASIPPAEREDIRLSPGVTSPATFGSTILLPVSASEWSEAKFLAVLTHERSHVHHRDSYVQWLSCLHTCLFWFNPLAWWLNRRLAYLAETTSDDAVLESMPDRAAYASLLLEMARQPRGASVVMSAARSDIGARIERIISNSAPAQPMRRRIRALVVIGLMPALAIAAATVRPVSPGGDDTKPARILNYGSLPDLRRFYPAEAKRVGIETIVDVKLTFDATGTVIEAVPLDPTPRDQELGFPDAATAVAKTVKFRNTTGALEQARLRVKFALDK